MCFFSTSVILRGSLWKMLLVLNYRRVLRTSTALLISSFVNFFIAYWSSFFVFLFFSILFLSIFISLPVVKHEQEPGAQSHRALLSCCPRFLGLMVFLARLY